MEIPVALHIVDLASVVAFVLWIFANVKQLGDLSANAKEVLGVVVIVVVAVIDNVVFYSGNQQLINVVTTLYQIILMAVGAIGGVKAVGVAADKYQDVKEKRALTNAQKLVDIMGEAGLEVNGLTVAAMFPKLPDDTRAAIRSAGLIRPGAAVHASSVTAAALEDVFKHAAG